MFKLDLEKTEEPEITLPASIGSSKKQDNSKKKKSTSASLTILVFDGVGHNKLENSLKRWEYQTTWPASWEICMQAEKQQLELDMEQQTGSK